MSIIVGRTTTPRLSPACRSYALDSIVNYGALPRTYEDPAHVDALVEARSGGAEKLLGDGDPLDVCEIGVESRNIMVSEPLGDGMAGWLAAASSVGRGEARNGPICVCLAWPRACACWRVCSLGRCTR